MSKSHKGNSLLKSPRMHLPDRYSSQPRSKQLSLESIRGEVHRFMGTVDKIGSGIKATGVVETICIRDLVHCRTNQRIHPDHWWFRMRQAWMDAGLKPGDQVIFVAKVQRCTKGLSLECGGTGRHQIIGFGSRIKSLIIKESIPASA